MKTASEGGALAAGGSNELVEITRCIESVGDKEVVHEVIISNFMNSGKEFFSFADKNMQSYLKSCNLEVFEE